MTTITQNIADIEGMDDRAAWVFYTKVIRQSGDDADTIITPKKKRKYPSAGVLTAELDPGPAVVIAADGNHYVFTVPEEDTTLWPLIEDAIAYPPNTPQALLNAAVGTYVETNRAQFRTRAVPVDPEDPETLWQWRDANGDDVGPPVEFTSVMALVTDYDPRLDDTRTPIDGSVTLTKLHADLSSVLGGMASTFFTTASGFVTNADLSTDATQKSTVFGVPHYTNTEEPICGMRVVARSATNLVQIGGGTSLANAATTVSFYTAADSTSTTGTLRSSIAASGLFTHLADAVFGEDTAAARQVAIRAAAGQARTLAFQSGSSNRWLLRCTNASESGSDAGSNLQVESRTDAGAAKTTVLDINRASGQVTLLGLLSTLESSTATAGLRLPHGAAPTSPTNGDMWTTTGGLFAHINGVTQQAATLDGTETFTAKTLTAPVIDRLNDANGNEQIVFTATASAVNEVGITNAAATSHPVIAARGGDTNINLDLAGKGTGGVRASGSIVVTLTHTQTILNKTLTAPKITAGGAPANASDTGTTGQIAWDATHFYVCTATNTWVRGDLASW